MPRRSCRRTCSQVPPQGAAQPGQRGAGAGVSGILMRCLLAAGLCVQEQGAGVEHWERPYPTPLGARCLAATCPTPLPLPPPTAGREALCDALGTPYPGPLQAAYRAQRVLAAPAQVGGRCCVQDREGAERCAGCRHAQQGCLLCTQAPLAAKGGTILLFVANTLLCYAAVLRCAALCRMWLGGSPAKSPAISWQRPR